MKIHINVTVAGVKISDIQIDNADITLETECTETEFLGYIETVANAIQRMITAESMKYN